MHIKHINPKNDQIPKPISQVSPNSFPLASHHKSAVVIKTHIVPPIHLKKSKYMFASFLIDNFYYCNVTEKKGFVKP